MKRCKHCNIEKPIDDFYTQAHTKDGHMGICKTCKKAKTKKRSQLPKHPKHIAGEESERMVIRQLIANGIYSVPGKASEYKRADIVSWGCVRIEAKASHFHKTQYHFGFTSQSHANNTNADIVCLYCIDGIRPGYYLFRSSHRVFYKTNGQLKRAVAWTPRTTPKRKASNVYPITDYVMEKHQNNWGIIEEIRLEKIEKLKAGEGLGDEQFVSEVQHLSLFD